MNIVEEQFEKLLYSIDRFKEDIKNGDKRAAIGDMDFVLDRGKSIIYLLLAQLVEENCEFEQTDEYKDIIEKLINEPKNEFESFARGILFTNKWSKSVKGSDCLQGEVEQ